jgi:IS30 family transposase
MPYKHLSHEERFTIETLNSKKYPYTKIAEIIGRHPSPVWGELKRKAHG